MTNKKNGILAISFAVFAISFILHALLHFSAPLYISGFFLALFIPGFAIKNVINPKEDWLNNLLAAPVFTIFFFVPLYYMATLILHGKINFALAFVFIAAISLLSFILTYKKEDPRENDNSDNKYLYFGIGAFILIHLATTLVYKFIPEIDGYTDLAHIENVISSGIFNISVRSLFSFLVSYIALISQIPPYWLFKFGMILIQVSGIYYLYKIIKIAEVKQSFTKYLILLSLISVPVINLEIDYVRPNVIFIMAILPFIYYLSRGLEGEKKYFLFSSVIVATGLFIHEFFIILFLINLFSILNHFYQKLIGSKKITAWAIGGVIFFMMLLNIDKFNFLLTPLQLTGDFIKMAQTGLKWNWWFLGGYSNIDGFNLGWTGFKDVFNYYAYSVSPFLAFSFLLYLFVLIKKVYSDEKIFPTEKIAIFLLFLGLFFAEFLPRIDFKTLPDRFWPMISMSLIALSPFVFSKLNLSNKKPFRFIIIILLFVGILGSIYIAKAKGGYTSDREYAAAQWAKRNTPENSFFITQGGNGVMLNYFAKRKNIFSSASLFLSENNHDSPARTKISERIYKNIVELFNESLADPRDDRLTSLNQNLKAYHEEIEKEKLAKNLESQEFVLPKNENVYVLYSFDKFNNYYVNRKWWRDMNFYGADLNKFKDGYELVYNDNDIVYIWKKK